MSVVELKPLFALLYSAMLASCAITAIAMKFLFARYPYNKLDDEQESPYDDAQTPPGDEVKEDVSVARV
jgi:hypothetical protein